MILSIDDNKTTSELQDKFNECFPFLKIEFYDVRHKWQESSFREHRIIADKKIGEIRKNHNSGALEIKSWYKTGKVEQDFRHFFGLFVQIFFLENGDWVESVSADDLSLAHLNEMGQKDMAKKA
ncbi:hypothetical protein [Segetibacter koreensis]|uniref:hypothetical protein n=1 Tax=Segetibacter koreensis TaxID=398037 RepID=UPI00036C5DB3|nr:hypothetical protein [Segetibacter koreensis]